MKKHQVKLAAYLTAVLLLSASLLSCAYSGDGSLGLNTSKSELETTSDGENTTGDLSTTAAPTTDASDSQTTEETPDTETPTDIPTVSTTDTSSVEEFDPLAFYDYQYEFKADLSKYEEYMNILGEDYLILVNVDHPLSSSYVPGDLVKVVNTRADRAQAELRLYAAKALEAMYIEADANGMLYKNRAYGEDGKYYHDNILSVTTAYRSYATQRYLYNSYVERDMKLYPNLTKAEVEALVATYSCPPGTSEHQTGLCVDMHNWPTAGRYMANEFAASEAGQWLIENCYKFGFILRFDKDKSDVTGITYESWHFRYVGRFHATRMHELGMCLEEYVEYLAGYGYEINSGFDGMA